MPTLIRLLVFLLILAGLAFGGMIALVATVDPGVKEYRVRIPPRELTPQGTDLRDTLPGLNEDVAPIPPPAEAAPAPPAAAADPAAAIPPE